MRILITGHTGFVGSWLTLSLLNKGAEIAGFSLDPPTNPSLYYILGLKDEIQDYRGNICNIKALRCAENEFKPEVVIHLAAQPIVKSSYERPLETFYTNIIGTANINEIVKESLNVESLIVFTSDKVYRNDETHTLFTEIYKLGGYDPYSASKSCADIITNSYRRNIIGTKSKAISTIRAGNIIGGGDWGKYRLITDLVRSITHKEKLKLRNPTSVRPWQHVLDVINGLIKLIDFTLSDPDKYSEDYNFGPYPYLEFTVEDFIHMFGKFWEVPIIELIENDLNESKFLGLDSSKAHEKVGWQTFLQFPDSIKLTTDWYKAFLNEEDMKSFSLAQLKNYEDKFA